MEVPVKAVRFSFSRSSGPGGQNVNRRETRVEATLDLEECEFDQETFDRVKSILGDRLVDGKLRVVAEQHRTQLANRRAALERLDEILTKALAPPPPARKKTTPSKSSVQRRLDEKSRRSVVKRQRSSTDDD